MKSLFLFVIILAIPIIPYIHYRVYTRKRIYEVMDSYGIKLKDREILLEVWQYYWFLKKTKDKTSPMRSILIIGLIEVLVILAANIFWIAILIRFFNQ